VLLNMCSMTCGHGVP